MQDLVIHNAKLVDWLVPVSIAVQHGRILSVGGDPGPGASEFDAAGRMLLPGFVETHIHLDKSGLLGCCGVGATSLAEAIRDVARAKSGFTEADIRARARRTLEKAILHGTTRMRTHVEVDPRIGLRGFEAVRQLRAEYAWAIEIKICVFPQEGLLNDPGTQALLVEALEAGADLIGGCPYTDSDPPAQIRRVFDLARRYDVDVDFHLDFDLDPSWMHLDEVCDRTDEFGWGGRVAIGHATKLSSVGADALASIASRLRASGVALTVLPATDLYLMGRHAACNVPRGVTPAHLLKRAGVTCSIATNNVLNPFTPFGDCSLLRMANLYANVCQVPERQFLDCLDLVTSDAAALLRLSDYGIRPGNPADFVILDAADPTDALAEIAPVRHVYKRGLLTVDRPSPRLLRPMT